MPDAKRGESFIKHELDEAIAIQGAVVECTSALSHVHPDSVTRQLLTDMNESDQRQLRELRRLGQGYGADGEVEEVAGSLMRLAAETSAQAGAAPSEAYEAHVVLLTLKRKQLDSIIAMLEVADARRLVGMHASLELMLAETRVAAAELSQALTALAVRIAASPAGLEAARA